MKMITILFDSVKLSLFATIIFFAVLKQNNFVSILQILMVVVMAILLAFFAWYAADNYKKALRAGVAALEFVLLGLAFCYFWQNNILNSVAFLWLFPFAFRIYLPNFFPKKRNT